ncbi:MAG: hypothetical protein ACE5Q6_02650 [Dehalococcoidia bacterium]
MFRRKINRHNHRFGSLFGGLLLAALGLLQFFQTYLGIPWSELWPLFLVVPGLALVLRALTPRAIPPHEEPAS